MRIYPEIKRLPKKCLVTSTPVKKYIAMNEQGEIIKMKKIQGLNLLKILACVVIFCHHYQQYFNVYFEGKVNFFNGNFYFGYVVELFFMISGILAYNSYIEKGSLPSFTTYIKGKFLRFFPTTFLALTFLYLFEWIVYFIDGKPFFWKLPTLVDYVLCIFLLDNGWGFESLIPDWRISWYVGVLLLLYAIFWCVTKICEKRKASVGNIAFLCFIAGSAVFFNENELLSIELPLLGHNLSRGVLSFFMGIVVYSLVKNYQKAAKLYASIGLPLITGMMIYDYNMTQNVGNPLIGQYYWGCILILYPSILIIAMTSKFIGKISKIKILDKFERLTFPVYLYQAFLLTLFAYFEHIGWIQINHGYKSMFVAVVLIFGVSYLIDKYIRVPFEKAVYKLLDEE